MTLYHHSSRRRYGTGIKGLVLDMAISGTAWTWTNRARIAPLIGAAVTAPAALTAHGMAHIPGAMPYVIAGEVVALAAATSLATLQPQEQRWAGYLSTAVIGGTGVWASIAPWQAHPWGVLALGAVGCQAAWWVGRAMTQHDPIAKATRRGERLIADARWDGHVAAVSRPTGCTEWRITLGLGTRAGNIKLADVAHILGVTADRVHVWPGQTSREVTIRVMHKRPNRKPARHPALLKNTRNEWAPGARSVVDPIPVGPSPAGLDEPVTMSPRPDGDVSHLLVAGMTGSGKSYSLSSLLVGLMACRDVVIAGSDIPKAGQTLDPFSPAMARVSGSLADLAADLDAIEKLSQARIRRMTAIREDKWTPTVHGPLLVYVIEEWAATVSMATADKSPEALAVVALVDRLAATVRSAGISLLIVTQRPDRESMGSTRLRSNIASMMIHKVRKRADLLGLADADEMDLSALSRPGDAYISCGSAGVSRGRAYAVPPKDRWELAERYSERPALHPEDAEILRSAGWTVTTTDGAPPTVPAQAAPVDETPAASAEASAEVPEEFRGTLDDIASLSETYGPVPHDAPADVIMCVLLETLGEREWVTVDEVLTALGWPTDNNTKEGAAARQRLSAAVTKETKGAVKTRQKRLDKGKSIARAYFRDDLAGALTQTGSDTGGGVTPPVTGGVTGGVTGA